MMSIVSLCFQVSAKCLNWRLIFQLSFVSLSLVLSLLQSQFQSPDFARYNSCIRHGRSLHGIGYKGFIRGGALSATLEVKPNSLDHDKSGKTSNIGSIQQAYHSSTTRNLRNVAMSLSPYRIPANTIRSIRPQTANQLISESFSNSSTPIINVKSVSNVTYTWRQRLLALFTFIKRLFYRVAAKSEEMSSSIKTAIESKEIGGPPLKHVLVDWAELEVQGINPAIVFVNKKSGGLQGQRALDTLRQTLPHIQVCDLHCQRPAEFLSFYKNSSLNLNIICCGGDGTVNWIMDEARKAGLTEPNLLTWVKPRRIVSFGIVPFGTGNDLFQHFRKLSNVSYDVSPKALVASCEQILQGFCVNRTIEPLDRWSLQLSPKPKLIRRLLSKAFTSSPGDEGRLAGNTFQSSVIGNQSDTKSEFAALTNRLSRVGINPNQTSSSILDRLKRRSPPSMSVHKLNLMRRLKQYSNDKKVKKKVFNNYFGIGVDGAVTIAFDELRRQIPSLFFSRIINKMWYAVVGFVTFLAFWRTKDLSKCMELICDGVVCPIPPGSKGLIFTNINSYAGGSKLWVFEDYFPWKPQVAGDGIIEVVAVTGITHLGRIKTGLSQAIPIAQGRTFQLVTKEKLSMQMDGEPWRQRACTIELKASDRVDVIVPIATGDNR